MNNIINIWGNAKSVGIALMSVILIGLPIATYAGAPTVLITGSSRGIVFELSRQYAQQGWTVIATCRTPEMATALQALAKGFDNVTIERLDVTDHARIDELAAQYEGTAIDVLLNNAGINPGRVGQHFGAIDYAEFLRHLY